MSRLSAWFGQLEPALANAPEWVRDTFGGPDAMLFNLLQAVVIGATGWLVAALAERRHVAAMTARERDLAEVHITASKSFPPAERDHTMMLVGSVVITHDYWRTLVIFIRTLLGGNIQPYERLVQRGRREALIRLKEEAHLRGMDRVVNVRFLGNRISAGPLKAVEMVAFGTGIRCRPTDAG